MATVQSNPTYYLLSSLSSGRNSSTREIILHRKLDYDGFGIYIGEDVPSGLYIVTVERGSPAADANILPGDRIIALDGQLISTIENPKDKLVRLAGHSETLRLTVESTTVYNDLTIPLKNTYTEDKNDSIKNHSSIRTIDANTDLESYIKSLFINEDVQIVPSSNNNEFIIYTNPNQRSSMQFNSSLPVSSHSKERKTRRRSHREPRPKIFVSKETQTSMDEEEEENEIIAQELPPVSPFRSIPSMGTPQRILRTQQTAPNDNITTPAVAVVPSSQHMADVVTAAIAAQRRRAENPEPVIVPPRELTPSPPPQKEDPAFIPIPVPIEIPSSPPAYSVTDTLAQTNNNPESVDEGSYNVRGAQENRQVTTAEYDTNNIPPSITGSGVHVVHLYRSEDFQGFGFHLQYNKIYFLVQKIEEASPAEKSGLAINEVILAINEHSTENMPHAEFVRIVSNNSKLDFVVQPVDDYLHSNFRPPPNKLLAATNSSQETTSVNDTNKSGIAKVLSKIKSR